MVLAGLSKAQMIDSIKAGFDNRELPTPAPGAMCYMMSRAGYLNDAVGHYVPHLMFYFPLTDKSSWGADLPDSPVTLNPQFQGGPEPITEFVIPVGKWSDGTVAPVMSEFLHENERASGFHSSQPGAEVRKPIQRRSVTIF